MQLGLQGGGAESGENSVGVKYEKNIEKKSQERVGKGKISEKRSVGTHQARAGSP